MLLNEAKARIRAKYNKRLLSDGTDPHWAVGLCEAPGYHPNDHVTTSFTQLKHEDGRRHMINMVEGLNR